MNGAIGIKELALKEPWRMGQGQAFNELDQVTEEQDLVSCDYDEEEDIEFDDDGWWWCHACGFCGHWSTLEHYEPDHPEDFYERSLEFFVNMKEEQGLSREEANQQAFHLLGMALRAAATTQPDALTDYIEKHIRLDKVEHEPDEAS